MSRCFFAASILTAGLLILLAACSSDPDKEKLKYFDSGVKYFKAGKYEAARIQFINAIKLDPKFEQAHYQLARTYLKLTALSDARRELETTVSLNPKNSDAQLQLAGLLLGGRRFLQNKKLVQ